MARMVHSPPIHNDCFVNKDFIFIFIIIIIIITLVTHNFIPFQAQNRAGGAQKRGDGVAPL